MGPRWKWSWIISTTVKDQESSIKFIFFNFRCFFFGWFVYFEHWCISISIFISIYIFRCHICLPFGFKEWDEYFRWNGSSCQPFGVMIMIAFWWHTAVQSIDFVWSLSHLLCFVCGTFQSYFIRFLVKKNDQMCGRNSSSSGKFLFFFLFRDTAQCETLTCILILRMKLQTINPKMMGKTTPFRKLLLLLFYFVLLFE